jgi:serine/threonine-protein kinase
MASGKTTSQREMPSPSSTPGPDDVPVASPADERPAAPDAGAANHALATGDTVLPVANRVSGEYQSGQHAKGGDEADPLIGAVISERYRLLERVGEGGMGAVYRGEHVTLRKRVAVKFLHAELSRIADVVARFEREAIAAANLEHPNVVAAHDFGKTKDGQFYLVMEFVEGGSLRDLLDKEGRLAPARAVQIARHIAAALQRAHALEIVHRDLKPENVVLVERDGDKEFAKVIDFGIAKVAGGRLDDGGKPLTQAGMVFGTPDYMAPEQALGGKLDHRADLYAFGIMVYEMLVGERPFTGDDVMAVLGQHMTQPPPSASQKAPPGVLPLAVDGVLARMLAKSPSERFDSANEFVHALESALGLPTVPVGGTYPPGLLVPPAIATPPFGIAAPPPSTITGSTPAISVASVPAAVGSTTGNHAAVTSPPASIPLATITPVSETAKATIATLKEGYGELRKDPQRHKRAMIGAAVIAALVVIFAVATRPMRRPAAVAPTPTPHVPASLAHAPTHASDPAPAIAPGPTAAATDTGAAAPQPSEPSATADAGDGIPAQLAAQIAEYQSRPNVRLLLDHAHGRQLRPVIAAFEQTRAQAPNDAILNYLLGTLYMRARGRGASALERYADAIRLEPGFARERTIARDVVNAFAASRQPPPQAVALLTGPLAQIAGPLLLDALMSARGAPTRARLASVLSAAPFNASADPTLRGLIELASASSCEQKLPVVQQLGREADARALPYLRSIRVTPNGCGIFGVMACNPCLNEALPAALVSIQQRAH